MFRDINHRHLKFIAIFLFLGFVKVSFGQVTCSHLSDSLQLTSDTVYIDQPIDTTTILGVQWMGYNGLSYTIFRVNYDDSTDISLVGGTVSGGLQSPYPSPELFPLNISYHQPSIPVNTVINTFIEVFGPNLADTCYIPITFIVNPNPVSVSENGLPTIVASAFPNPMTSSSTLEVSDDIQSGYHFLVYDMTGKVIHRSEKLRSKTYRLDRSVFKASGIYLIEIKSIDMKSKLVKILVK